VATPHGRDPHTLTLAALTYRGFQTAGDDIARDADLAQSGSPLEGSVTGPALDVWTAISMSWIAPRP
jgi:hypothetical protein